MSLRAELSPGDGDTLNVTIPSTRSDILHECDIMEDAAIAYGFNNLPDAFPATSTVAQPLAVSKLSDIIRHEWAYAGWVEVLPLILVRIASYTHPATDCLLTTSSSRIARIHVQCSHEENFAWLRADDDGQTAVKIANPKTLEFQVVRTSLLPGLLKTIRENRSHALPLRIFETSDVVFKDVTRERQARNVRHAAAVWCNKTAGFEIVHGLLDRAMAMLEVPHVPGGGGGGGSQAVPTRGYYLKERNGASVVV
jgi:phenylalanyl-tRNA synthetase beta chain